MFLALPIKTLAALTLMYIGAYTFLPFYKKEAKIPLIWVELFFAGDVIRICTVLTGQQSVEVLPTHTYLPNCDQEQFFCFFHSIIKLIKTKQLKTELEHKRCSDTFFFPSQYWFRYLGFGYLLIPSINLIPMCV